MVHKEVQAQKDIFEGTYIDQGNKFGIDLGDVEWGDFVKDTTGTGFNAVKVA